MSVFKATKKPVTDEVLQWTGENAEEVTSFLRQGEFSAAGYVKGNYVEIGTRDGLMIASQGDYIIKGVKGEFYPYTPDIFEATYDFPVE